MIVPFLFLYIIIMKKLTNEIFIEKAKKIHNNKYDYSLVDYKNNDIKIKIICPNHGVFEQKPKKHLRGQGCFECNGNKKKTNEEFIDEANKIHINKYNYSLIEYNNNKTKIKIICSEHGIFEQAPINHLNGNGCPKCVGKNKTNNDFIKKVKKFHGDKYDYSLVDYKNAKTKVKIICPIHGVFEQRPYSHMYNGCPKCANNIKYTTEDFIKKAKKIHNNKYDYSLINYENNHTKVKIICFEHGVFKQIAKNHLSGNGCPKCANNIKYTTEDFIQKAKKIHDDKYDYSLVKYNNSETKVKIICPEHGVFEQIAYLHLKGYGCKNCATKNIRLKTLERIKNNLKNGYQIIPNFNPKACEIFDKISEKKNIKIQHAMNGGEYYIKKLGYWVDGYDKENNVVYEFDEKYHDSEIQKEKDLVREQEIINLLKCKFIRIKEK